MDSCSRCNWSGPAGYATCPRCGAPLSAAGDLAPTLVQTSTSARPVLLLKLLIFSPTGAIAAAATTSLPERRPGGKNWDYRFAWVRDTAYTLSALRRFGIREETHAAVTWLLRTVRRHGVKLVAVGSGIRARHGVPPLPVPMLDQRAEAPVE